MSTAFKSTNTKNTTSVNEKEAVATLSEHLSALFDDEAGSFEQQRVLNELKVDEELSNKLSNFALIGETLRSGKPAITADANFLAGIHNLIDSEPAYTAPVLEDSLNKKQKMNTRKNAWLRPVGGFAMAASVAALAVISFQNYSNQSGEGRLKPQSTEIVASTATSSMFNKQPEITKAALSQEKMDAAVIIPADQMNKPITQEKMVLKSATSNSNISNTNSTVYRQADARTRSLLKRYVDSHMQYASTSAFVPSVRIISYSDFQ